jgi:CRISPR-associated protein (TIGR03986 family)
MIRAPYNFVPLNKKVLTPEWAEFISHDIPFSDGESGEISVSIEARSPIFISDGEEETKFSHYRKNDNLPQYFIPGSSLKGLVRNVLEILSYSKMNKVKLFNPAYRDLSSNDVGKTYKENMKGAQCGWLKRCDSSESGYRIRDCGEPWRISHETIDNHFTLNDTFFDLFNNDGAKKIDFNKNQFKSAEFKYKLVEGQSKKSRFIKFKHNNFIEAIPEQDGDMGTIVFTGQPGERNEKKKSGKKWEFVFIEPENENVFLELDKSVFDNFRIAYHDEDKNNESLDWKYWKQRLSRDEEIPIFFKKDADGNVAHFGLSYLYKLPYSYGIKDCIPESHFTEAYDLPECLFGSISKEKSLKGRVQFSMAKCISENPKVLPLKKEVLSSPKPTYYPIYIKLGDYNTPNSLIAGRKRYPIQKNISTYIYDPKINLDRLATKFEPLDAGTKFNFKIRFHNLKKAELGALLSALTFHGSDNLYHSLGMAKPLGYGKCSFKVENLNGVKHSFTEYIKAFEIMMEEFTNDKWINSESIRELITMAAEQDIDSKLLTYMDLKEYQKLQKYKFKYYSEQEGVKPVKIVSFIPEEEKKAILREREEKKIKKNKAALLKKLKDINSNLDIDKEMHRWVNEFDKDKELAELLITKVKKKNKNKEYTFDYKMLAECLGISLNTTTQKSKYAEAIAKLNSSNTESYNIYEKYIKHVNIDDMKNDDDFLNFVIIFRNLTKSSWGKKKSKKYKLYKEIENLIKNLKKEKK